MNDLTIIGKTNWRNEGKVFGIKDQDRLGHIYAIGKTGTGKSTLLQNMAISDIERGKGICLIDPHGDLAEDILNYIPKERIKDVIYFDAGNTDFPIAFNPLNNVSPSNFNLVTAGLISTFKKLWIESWGPRLEHILRYSILSLLYYSKATLLDIQPLLTNYYFRTNVLSRVTDFSILSFWKQEFDTYTPAFRSEAIAPILNKTGLLIASSALRNIVGQQSSLTIRQIMDDRKILICNFSKGKIGEDASALLGSMLLTAIQSATLSRASDTIDQRTPFYLYVDEVHSFITNSFIDMLAESRKFGLSLFLTHQYIEQLPEAIRSAIFGNVGTLISFRIGADDAKYVAKEFFPVFKEDDLVNLPKYSMYVKLMIDGATSKPFSAESLQLKNFVNSHKNEIISLSKKRYPKTKNDVNYNFIVQGHNRDIRQPKLFK